MTDAVEPARTKGYFMLGEFIRSLLAAQAAKKRSDEIDVLIDEEGKKFDRACKVLLLGLGGSGKSTILKQMKIMHQNGFADKELESYRLVVYKNVVDCAHALVRSMREINVEPERPINRVLAEKILNYHIESGPDSPSPPPDIVGAIHQLWQDPMIPSVMDNPSTEIYRMDNVSFFLSAVQRIGTPGYLPTPEDVLCARETPTYTGITETLFNIGQLSIRVIDVGSQPLSRMKWLYHFQSVTSIIFCTAISDYDLLSSEDSTLNGLSESLSLFDLVINSRCLRHTTIILFLNKLDIFRMKLPKVPLEQYFPEYEGGNSINLAVKFILRKLMEVNRGRLSVYPHLTQATDVASSNLRLVLAVVKETILSNALRVTETL